MPNAIVKNLKPTSLIDDILSQKLTSFAALNAETPFLLVNLSNDPGGDMEAALSAIALRNYGVSPSGQSNLDFYTVAQSELKRQAALSLRSETNRDRLKQRILEKPHFVFSLMKFPSKMANFGHISLGRFGRTNKMDIILRHGSISKFHGWFEMDTDKALYVVDAGSKNGVAVDDETITSYQSVKLGACSIVRLGSIVVSLCYADDLWRIVHDR